MCFVSAWNPVTTHLVQVRKERIHLVPARLGKMERTKSGPVESIHSAAHLLGQLTHDQAPGEASRSETVYQDHRYVGLSLFLQGCRNGLSAHCAPPQICE
jgi:hypothetical protein